MSDKFHILTSLLLFSLGAPHLTPHPTGKGTQSTGKNMVAFGSIQHLPRGALSRTATFTLADYQSIQDRSIQNTQHPKPQHPEFITSKEHPKSPG